MKKIREERFIFYYQLLIFNISSRCVATFILLLLISSNNKYFDQQVSLFYLAWTDFWWMACPRRDMLLLVCLGDCLYPLQISKCLLGPSPQQISKGVPNLIFQFSPNLCIFYQHCFLLSLFLSVHSLCHFLPSLPHFNNNEGFYNWNHLSGCTFLFWQSLRAAHINKMLQAWCWWRSDMNKKAWTISFNNDLDNWMTLGVSWYDCWQILKKWGESAK